MRAIVVMLLLLAAALNGASTARAAGSCLRVGEAPPAAARALVAARPHASILRAIETGTQDARGRVVVRPGGRACTTTYWLERDLYTTLAVTGPGWSGTIRSDSTRIDGLVAAADVAKEIRGDDVLHAGGHANLDLLAVRIARAWDQRVPVRLVVAALMIALLLVRPRRALLVGPAAVSAALVMSAFDSTSIALFALLALVGAFAPREALWVFLAGYVVVLAVWPETQSLAMLGPHPGNGGRFYGMTNEVETLLLAPALLLGLAAAPLVLVAVGWSRAGADGGGVLSFLGGYAALVPRPSNRLILVYVAAAVAVAAALVAVDAATGGHSHVITTVGGGPGDVWHAFTHRWSVSWHGATANGWRILLVAACLGALVWVALQSPRHRLVDAFLVAIAVSLVVNDTPQDVVLWGSLQALALRRAL